MVKADGSKQDILTALPSFSDHHNNRVIFGPDGKMYFGEGTTTNSGVVGGG
jgi:glucose/arabinose dehydrogenase